MAVPENQVLSFAFTDRVPEIQKIPTVNSWSVMNKKDLTLETRRPYWSQKPRANGSSSSISATTSQTLDTETSLPTDYFSAARTTDAVVTSSIGAGRSRRDSRHKIRAHLCGSTELSYRESSDEDNEGKSGIVEAARGVKNRLSRTSTMVSQLPSARRSRSLISHPHSQASTASLGQELDNNQLHDQIKERAFYDQLAALNHVSSPADEDPHTDSIASPIRRKSLLTPGIATRTPNDILRKPPQLEPPLAPAIQDYYFNPGLSTSSPLSRLAGFGPGNNEEASPISRAATPADLDYTHLGGLKLGTLRITNGSDTHSMLHQPHSPDSNCPQDQLMTSEYTRHEEVDVNPVKEGVHCRHNGQSIDWTGTSERSDRRSSEISRVGRSLEKRTVEIGRSGSPLQQQQLRSNFSSKNESSGNRFAVPSFMEESPALQYAKSYRLANKAEDYTSELLSNPFTFPSSPHPTRPKHETNVQPNLPSSFTSESRFNEPAAHHQWNAFLNETEKTHSTGESFAYNFSTTNTSKSSISYFSSESRPVSSSTLSDSIHPCDSNDSKALTVSAGKQDSGYCSCTSVQSLGQPMRPTLKSYVKRSSCTSDALDTTSDHHYIMSLKGSNSSAPDQPRQPVLHDAKPIKNSALDSPSQDSPFQNSPSQDSPSQASPSQASPKAKDLAVATPISPTKNPGTLRKLRKARPIFQPPSENRSVLQDWQDLSQTIVPPIPIDIAKRHAERQNQFPLLEHTFPSLHHTRSRDGSSSPDLVFVPIRFPSPENDPMEDSITTNNLMNFSSKDGGSRSPRRSSWKDYASITRLKSQRRRSGPPLTNGTDAIADLGTVTESLGGSPYDIARSTLIAEPHVGNNAGISHPHQMTTATPRAKSISGMTDAYAAQLMRSRSQYRGEDTPSLATASYSDVNERQGRPRSLALEPTATRPSKMSHSLFNGCQPKSFKATRPRSMFADVPPLPQIRSAKQDESATPSRAHSSIQADDNSEIPWSQSTVSNVSLASDTFPAGRIEARAPSRRSFNDPDRYPSKMLRPRSMYAEIPPVPALPSAAQVELREAQIYRSYSAQPQQTPQAPKDMPVKVNEVQKAPKTTEESMESRQPVVGMQSWEAQSETWAKLRSIAKDEVIKRAQTPKVVTPMEDDFSTSQPPQRFEAVRPRSAGSYRQSQHLKVPRKISKSSDVSLAPPLRYSISPNGSTTSLNSSVSTGSHVQRLSGRYEGGFFFGYEPGFGLGGSAGTRNAKSGATRKSIDVSVAYGLDLSDLPIMVRPR